MKGKVNEDVEDKNLERSSAILTGSEITISCPNLTKNID